jgi:Lar family restriction alleviation protein
MIVFKPCPFCGSTDIQVYEQDVTGPYDRCIVLNYTPGCSTSECLGEYGSCFFETAEKAIEAWNQRMS